MEEILYNATFISILQIKGHQEAESIEDSAMVSFFFLNAVNPMILTSKPY